MKNTSSDRELSRVLASLYPDLERSRLVMSDVGVSPERLPEDPVPDTRWRLWVEALERGAFGPESPSRLRLALIHRALEDYPGNPELRALERAGEEGARHGRAADDRSRGPGGVGYGHGPGPGPGPGRGHRLGPLPTNSSPEPGALPSSRRATEGGALSPWVRAVLVALVTLGVVFVVTIVPQLYMAFTCCELETPTLPPFPEEWRARFPGIAGPSEVQPANPGATTRGRSDGEGTSGGQMEGAATGGQVEGAATRAPTVRQTTAQASSPDGYSPAPALDSSGRTGDEASAARPEPGAPAPTPVNATRGASRPSSLEVKVQGDKSVGVGGSLKVIGMDEVRIDADAGTAVKKGASVETRSATIGAANGGTAIGGDAVIQKR